MSRVISSNYLLIVLLLLSDCKPVRHTHQAPVQPEAVSDPKLVFLTFTIVADSSGTNKVTLTNKKVVDGRKKQGDKPAVSLNHLEISILNRSHTVLATERVDHPLIKEAEYANDKGEFERKLLNLSQAEFFVRIQLPPDAEWVTVTEIINQKRINSSEFNLVK